MSWPLVPTASATPVIRLGRGENPLLVSLLDLVSTLEHLLTYARLHNNQSQESGSVSDTRRDFFRNQHVGGEFNTSCLRSIRGHHFYNGHIHVFLRLRVQLASYSTSTFHHCVVEHYLVGKHAPSRVSILIYDPIVHVLRSHSTSPFSLVFKGEITPYTSS